MLEQMILMLTEDYFEIISTPSNLSTVADAFKEKILKHC